MCPLYDDFDEFGFAGGPVLKSMRREQRRMENRYAKRKNPWRRAGDYLNPDDLEDFNDYDGYTEFNPGR